MGLREPDGAPCLIAVADGMDTSAVVAFDTSGLRRQRARDAAGLLVVLTRLYDATHLRYVTVDRLRRWAAEGVVSSVIDAETGVDVTRVLPA